MSAPATASSSLAPGLDTSGVPSPIAIVGPFQPAAIARLLPLALAGPLEGLTNFAGVPVNWLTGALVRAGVRTAVVGGVRGASPRVIASDPLSVYLYKGTGGWPFLLTGKAEDRAAILGYLEQIQPALVHAHWTFEAGRAVADWRGPKVLTVHDAAWTYARLGWSPHPVSLAFTARWLWNTRETFSRFQHLIAVSPYLESYLRRQHRFRGEIRVIPNAIPELPPDLIPPTRFPKSGAVTFGMYGEPGKLKNLLTAIKAFRLYAHRDREARLIIFGGGWGALQAQLTRGQRISFPGALPHAEFQRALVEQIDIWVHPSLVETQGIVLCEALLAGCPVIAGRDSGAVAWTLDGGNAGLLVDVTSPDAIAEAMRTLVRDPGRARVMVVAGQRSIRSRFHPHRIAQLHLEYYRDIVA